MFKFHPDQLYKEVTAKLESLKNHVDFGGKTPSQMAFEEVRKNLLWESFECINGLIANRMHFEQGAEMLFVEKHPEHILSIVTKGKPMFLDRASGRFVVSFKDEKVKDMEILSAPCLLEERFIKELPNFFRDLNVREFAWEMGHHILAMHIYALSDKFKADWAMACMQPTIID